MSGDLRIYLGYAAGVGKTYHMLEDAQVCRSKGIDVAIGYFEPHGRKDTIEKTEGLETIPRRRIDYRGTIFEEMDLPAILLRHPAVCVVDEFPHSNVPGLENEKRWQDVMDLLKAGIHVHTTMNVQHLESLNDQIARITGVRVRETIPDWVVKQATEVVMIDVPPRALLNRLQRGVVYAPEKARAALQNFFQEPTLVALREIALRQTAHEVDIRQVQPDYSLIEETPSVSGEAKATTAPDRILIHLTDHARTIPLIRRARRVADYLQAGCFAVAVRARNTSSVLSPALEKHLRFASNLQISTEIIEGDDPAMAVVDFARQNAITQIYLASPNERRWFAWKRTVVQKIVQYAPDRRVILVSDRSVRPS